MDPKGPGALCGETRQAGLLQFAWAFFAFSLLFICLRLFCKVRYSRRLAVDDYVAIGSWLSAVVGIAFLMKWIEAGLGLHLSCMLPSQGRESLKWGLAAQVESVVGMCLIKISVCIRVFQAIDQSSKIPRAFLWALIAFICGTHLSETIMLLFSCIPLRALWDATSSGGCLSHQQVYNAMYIHTAFGAFTDLICALLPLLAISQLHLKTYVKAGLAILSGLGLLVPCCAIAKAATAGGLWQEDFTWDAVAPTRWAVAEHILAIILASLPATKCLFEELVLIVSSHYWSRMYSASTPTIGSPARGRSHRRFTISTFNSEKISMPDWDQHEKALAWTEIQKGLNLPRDSLEKKYALNRETLIPVPDDADVVYVEAPPDAWPLPISKFAELEGSGPEVAINNISARYKMPSGCQEPQQAIQTAVNRGMNDYV